MSEVDMFGGFFLMNMDEFVQNVFLCLDPASLKNCRCVCKEWNCFIQENIWNSRLGRSRLREKLRLSWRKSSARVSEFVINGSTGISWIGCDQTFVYFGTWTEFMGAHEIVTGNLKHEVNFRDKPYSLYEADSDHCESMGVGEDYLAVVTDVGEIILMDMLNSNLSEKLGTQGRVKRITMSKNKVVAALDADLSRRARISTLEIIEGKWKIRSVVADDAEAANDVQVDGDWLVIGTRDSSNIWKLSELEKGPVYEVNAMTYRVVMHFPFLFVLTSCYPYGLQVWNVQENAVIREIESKNSEGFECISSNGEFLVVVPENEEHGRSHLDTPHHIVPVQLFEIKELIDLKIPDSQLWSPSIGFRVNKGDLVCASMNRTSLVIAAGLDVEVHKFWDD